MSEKEIQKATTERLEARRGVIEERIETIDKLRTSLRLERQTLEHEQDMIGRELDSRDEDAHQLERGGHPSQAPSGSR